MVTSHGPRAWAPGVDASGLALRLGVIIGAAFLVAYAIRRLAGEGPGGTRRPVAGQRDPDP